MIFSSSRSHGGMRLRVSRMCAWRKSWTSDIVRGGQLLVALIFLAGMGAALANGSAAAKDAAKRKAEVGQEAPKREAEAADEALKRNVAITELGFTKGLEFTSFGGQRDLFFPVPRTGLRAAVLRLKLDAGAAVAGRRHLQISAGERILQSVPLEGRATEQTIQQPLDPQLAKDGFLRVTLRYSGAFTQDRCVDERVAGDFVNILPETELQMELEPQAYAEVRSVAALMPRKVRIILPDRALTADEAASAVRVASVLKRQGASIAVEPAAALAEGSSKLWSRGTILVGQPLDFFDNLPEGTAINGIAVASTAAGPALLITGQDPGPAIALLGTRWKVLADGRTLNVSEVERAGGPHASISLNDLGASLQSADLVDQTRFDVTFSAERLPPGHRATAIQADLAIGVAPNLANATISVFLNGRLLGSRTSPGAVPATLTVSVPEGLIGRDNILSVRVQRQPHKGDCMNRPQGYPVQLLPSSALLLAPSSGPPANFYALGSAFVDGTRVYLPQDTAKAREALGLLAATAADLLPEMAPVTVRFGAPGAPPDVPFIAVLQEQPPGTKPPLRFDQGRLSIDREDGKALVRMSETKAPAVAQIVHSNSTVGLWLRPADAMPAGVQQPVRLDRGDVAVIEPEGITLAFSAGRDQVVSIAYHDVRSWADLAWEYRPWIVAMFWLAMTILFISVLSAIYRRRRKG